ncbi:hypothetical protein HWV62_37998 [Athelia sp. TMB]|nr:hypothetical protein HWV62_37998 [Athelia sp. TMB]
MISITDLLVLEDARHQFLSNDDYGAVELEEAMADVFGTDRSTQDAREWQQHWRDLEIYEEENRSDPGQSVPPQRPRHSTDAADDDLGLMDVDTSSVGSNPPSSAGSNPPSPRQLSTQLLQESETARAAERQQRRLNGNITPRRALKTGSKFDPICASLVIEVVEPNFKNVNTTYFYCIACDERRANNSRKRALPHVQKCKTLARDWPITFAAAMKELAGMSVESVMTGQSEAPPVRGRVKRKAYDEDYGRVPVSFSAPVSQQSAESQPSTSTADSSATEPSPPIQTTLESSWGDTSTLTAVRQALLDHLLLRFIVCCAISFAILDNGFFFDFVTALCPAYSVPDRSNFVSLHLAAEVESLAGKLLAYLATFIHLTLSFDGWSSKGHNEIYTAHVTTPGRRSFLVDGLILDGISPTGQNLFTLLSTVIIRFMAESFSLVVSDTTGNVKKCRRLICEKWPWILNCPDPCHQLNLMMKDIMVGTKKYGKPMTTVAAITTYFSHSNYGQHQLKTELAKSPNPDKRGIEAAGATRFSTFSTNARSVTRCFPVIQKLLTDGLIKFDTKSTAPLAKFFTPGPDSWKFQSQLHQINGLLTPIARGLETLEGQNTTCSDVFSIFVGIAIGFTRLFEDPKSEVFEHKAQTYGVFNRRFAIFLSECTPGMFLLAYLLDPIYHRDGALKLHLPPREAFSKHTVPTLVHDLIRYAATMLQNEQLRTKKGGSEQGAVLVKQLTAWMYREAPFQDPCPNPLHRLTWWKARAKDSNASVLAILAIKLFSVSPSEMCDERTASKMSAFNTAKRNGLSPTHIVHLAQLQQHWTYGFEDPTYTHTASLRLPKANPSSAIHLPAPTLQDLLNPTAADEDLLFNHPDPYGAEFLNDGDESDSDEDTSTSPPIVTRSDPVLRLEIESIVDLTNARLLARYAGPTKTGKEKETVTPDVEPTSGSPWVAEEWASNNLDF